jgi:hypothetical protein
MAAEPGGLMAARSDDGHRNMVPRWRYTGRTPFNAERVGCPQPRKINAPSADLSAAEALWRTDPCLVHAVELISSACASGRPLLALESAAWLHSAKIRVPDYSSCWFSHLHAARLAMLGNVAKT